MSKGILRRLMDIYMSNGIDENSAAQFAREFVTALQRMPAGTEWFVRGADGKEVRIKRN